jgi:hypothetical protein
MEKFQPKHMCALIGRASLLLLLRWVLMRGMQLNLRDI